MDFNDISFILLLLIITTIIYLAISVISLLIGPQIATDYQKTKIHGGINNIKIVANKVAEGTLLLLLLYHYY